MFRFCFVVLCIPSICSAGIKFGTLPVSSKSVTSAGRDVSKAACKIRTYVPGQPMIAPEFGSGVNTEAGVLTCFHVIQYAIAQGKTIEVECDGEKSVAVVTFTDPANDVAILRPSWQRDHVRVEIESNRPKIDDKVRTLCRLRDGNLGSEQATITGSSFDSKIMMDLATTNGMSGGGVVNADGKLIGIISGNIAIEPFQGLVIPLREYPMRSRQLSSSTQGMASTGQGLRQFQASGPVYQIQCNGRSCRKVQIQ